MELPHVTANDIEASNLGVLNVRHHRTGGQKEVFRCEVSGQPWALKVMKAGNPTVTNTDDMASASEDEMQARAEREIKLMGQFDSAHLVKMGPIGLTRATISGEDVIYFTEEWINGDDLETILQRERPFPIEQVIRLGRDVAHAVGLLWSKETVHRDIKPKNIMRRTTTGEYVLLDLGIALDLTDESITATGQWVRSPGYVSPEQMNPVRKRVMDARSDLFVLGIVMYQAVTGIHPFKLPKMSPDVNANIFTYKARSASAYRKDLPPKLDEILLKLLGKHPHQRYKNCRAFIAALDSVTFTKGA